MTSLCNNTFQGQEINEISYKESKLRSLKEELQEKENRFCEINEDISDFVSQWCDENDISPYVTLTQQEKKQLIYLLNPFNREKEATCIEIQILSDMIYDISHILCQLKRSINIPVRRFNDINNQYINIL